MMAEGRCPVAAGSQTHDSLALLLERLDLRRVETDVYVDDGAPDYLPRLFGGQVAAQALAATGRTVQTDRRVHSLHVYFLRPAMPNEKLYFNVERLKEARAFDTRRVTVNQHGKPILSAAASFHIAETGPEDPMASGHPVDPESLPRWEENFAGARHRLSPLWAQSRPLDMRYAQLPAALDPVLAQRPRRHQCTYLRADGAFPDDPLLHACLTVYASDMTLLETAILPHGNVWADGHFHGASLDHAMWFHRPFRADRWLRYEQHAECTGGSRGFATGCIYDEQGLLVVSVSQEGLLRPTHGAGTWLAGTAPHHGERRSG